MPHPPAIALALAALLPFAAAAQRAPQTLQITVERITPGREAEYAAIEERLAEICVRLRCPNAYLALESTTAPKEVLWLVEYASQADVARIAEAYARNEPLLAELRSAAATKKEQSIAAAPAESMTTLVPGGGETPWLVGRTALVVIAETDDAPGAVFVSADGRRFAVAAAKTRTDADEIAAKLGAAARVLAVRPEWSKPDPSWVEANGELWAPR
jgi:hypothetical protein